MKDMYNSINLIEIKSSDNMAIHLNTSHLVYVDSQKEITKQVDSLIYIINNTEKNDLNPQIIDLRFDNPIIT